MTAGTSSSELPPTPHHTATSKRTSRRSFAKAAGALGLAAAGLAATPLTARAQRVVPGPVWGQRAAQSWESLQRHFATDDGSHLVRERFPYEPDNDNPYSYEWPFSQVHGAALDLTGMVGAGSRFDGALADAAIGQSRYWSKAGSTGLPGHASYPMDPWGWGGDFFYDDNEWVGLIDVQRHLMLGGAPSDLDEAKAIFELVVSGWDTDPTHPAPGGVFWTQAPWSTDRNTVSNMPGAELGLRLHLITGEARYLEWSLKMYEWTNATLQRPDGLYHDNIKLSGDIDRTIWSYNQGVPIGVNTLLYLATRDKKYVVEAQRIADAAAAFYANGALEKQPPFFNSIYFKNLLLLASVTGKVDAHRRMGEYASWAWANRRDASSGLFYFPNDDPTRSEVIENAAMVQIMAVLAWQQRDWSKLY
ncbi:glycoside hydrolase family 76 protein [Aestuariimicrobium soli]|uniref:glycoside hydrolase family 76 protein n=1 Tax=Aestuariimicrobium soli TaxID=2035834 RepID=UPI003EB8FC69